MAYRSYVMNSSEKEDVIFAVKRLVERVRGGDVRFTDNVPQTVSELKAVRFDRAGEPIYETIRRWICGRSK